MGEQGIESALGAENTNEDALTKSLSDLIDQVAGKKAHGAGDNSDELGGYTSERHRLWGFAHRYSHEDIAAIATLYFPEQMESLLAGRERAPAEEADAAHMILTMQLPTHLGVYPTWLKDPAEASWLVGSRIDPADSAAGLEKAKATVAEHLAALREVFGPRGELGEPMELTVWQETELILSSEAAEAPREAARATHFSAR
jgi:hypothetical protein